MAEKKEYIMGEPMEAMEMALVRSSDKQWQGHINHKGFTIQRMATIVPEHSRVVVIKRDHHIVAVLERFYGF